MATKLTIEQYLKEKQYTFVALGLFASLTFQLSSSTGNFDSVFALISGLITQFLLISLNAYPKKEITITLSGLKALLIISSMAFPIWAIFRLPYLFNDLRYSMVFWFILMFWAIIHINRKEEI